METTGIVTTGIVTMMLFILWELVSIANSLKDISKSLRGKKNDN